ncbi:MAG: sugar transferase [Bacteroidetes bacterium]|nr:sugar transferase [Bacteroidota bacterium]
MHKRRLTGWYIVSDYLSSLAAWYCLYMFRKVVIEAEHFQVGLPFQDNQFFAGLFIVPEIWLLLHYISGTYTDLYRKSRLQEAIKTTVVILVGAILIFFGLLLDDKVRRFTDYYLTFAVLYAAQLTLTLLGRILLLNRAKANLRTKRFAYNTLLIGANQRAAELYEEFSAKGNGFGYIFCGYLRLNGETPNKVTSELQQLGTLSDLERIVDEQHIEEVIIAIESHEHHLLNDILIMLADKKVYIRIIPDMYDILSGTTKMNSIIGEAFIEIPPVVLSEWQRITKRWFDLIGSVGALIFTSPLLLYVALRIKFSSKGPVFYTQERLGQYGDPFQIIKFRSMYTDAEQHGPRLTTDDDPRITPVGRWIRKYRVDELPQFINVLKGEMSIVGPRAERRFFADQIIQEAPYYRHVFKVQPGITSLGMVKYGYASTVEEMVKRLKYDIIYMENMSILMDLKVIIYTVLTVLYGRGK